MRGGSDKVVKGQSPAEEGPRMDNKLMDNKLEVIDWLL